MSDRAGDFVLNSKSSSRRSRSFTTCRWSRSVPLISVLCWPEDVAVVKIGGFSPNHKMKLRVLYHGHCFDGVASAATFTRFYLERINHDAQVEYGGLLHRPGNLLFDRDMFDGDENAIVDFKYSPSPKLTWWFDHHQSAFLTAEDEAHFRADKSGRKFLDPTRKSCTEFIADIAQTKF